MTQSVKKKSLTRPTHKPIWLWGVIIFISIVATLGCSVGTLLVQVPTPTLSVEKTRQPTFTITPIKTATPTPTATPTETSTATPTPTHTPTPSPTSGDTSAAPAQPAQSAQPAAAPVEPAAPAEPPPTPTPAEPTATPTPAFPFNVVYYQHDTGSPGETRITGWIRLDIGPGQFKTLSNFQIKAVAPDGNTYLSEPSGSGTADSTAPGTGDNHRMNTKLEIKPYTPGVYKIQLVEGGVQVSQEIEVTLNAEPRQYTHLEFFKLQQP